MATSTSHVTALPPRFIIVRILQLLFSTVIFAICLFILKYNKDYTVYALLASAVFTLPVSIWIVVATYRIPKLYNYWAVFVMEILLFLIWVVALVWAVIISTNGYIRYSYKDCRYTVHDTKSPYQRLCSDYTPAQIRANNASTAVAAFTASNLTLWLVSMIVVSVYVSRHRKAGGHSKFGSQELIAPKNFKQEEDN